MTNITKVVLRVRANHERDWINNFMQGGWRVRSPDGSRWIQMNEHNTRIRNPFYDNTDPTSVLWLKPVEYISTN